MGTAAKRKGRLPEGLGRKGEPERIRDHPRQLFTMRPVTVARSEGDRGAPGPLQWRVVEDSIVSYLEGMTPGDRRAVEAIVKRSATARS